MNNLPKRYADGLLDRLSVDRDSQHFNEGYAKRIKRVFVDGVHMPKCGEFCISEGWARNFYAGEFGPVIHGKITVTLKPLKKRKAFRL